MPRKKPKASEAEQLIAGGQEAVSNAVEAVTDLFSALLTPSPTPRRKTWEELSPTYRRRLERQGISRESHASGESIRQARGHGNVQKDRETEAFRRQRDGFVNRMARFYGRDPDDVREALEGHSRPDMERAFKLQRDMERLYDAGLIDQAKQLWLTRDQSLPDWMFFYHGYFS